MFTSHSYSESLFKCLKLSFRIRLFIINVFNSVGELVGARLISHAGSLLNLAKHPASTVQILGAEKALFKVIQFFVKKSEMLNLVMFFSRAGNMPNIWVDLGFLSSNCGFRILAILRRFLTN